MNEMVLVMKPEDWEEYHWLIYLDDGEEKLKMIRHLLAKPDIDLDTISWLTNLEESLTDDALGYDWHKQEIK